MAVKTESGRKIAYADCFSGVSGDMLLAALLHAGFDRHLLLSELEKLGLPGLQVEIEEKTVQGISGLQLRVDSSRHQEMRTLPTIRALLEKSGLGAGGGQQTGVVVANAVIGHETGGHFFR